MVMMMKIRRRREEVDGGGDGRGVIMIMYLISVVLDILSPPLSPSPSLPSPSPYLAWFGMVLGLVLQTTRAPYVATLGERPATPMSLYSCLLPSNALLVSHAIPDHYAFLTFSSSSMPLPVPIFYHIYHHRTHTHACLPMKKTEQGHGTGPVDDAPVGGQGFQLACTYPPCHAAQSCHLPTPPTFPEPGVAVPVPCNCLVAWHAWQAWRMRGTLFGFGSCIMPFVASIPGSFSIVLMYARPWWCLIPRHDLPDPATIPGDPIPPMCQHSTTHPICLGPVVALARPAF